MSQIYKKSKLMKLRTLMNYTVGSVEGASMYIEHIVNCC